MAESGKLSRFQLKALVKECLIEILQEGLGITSVNSSQSTKFVTNDSKQKPIKTQSLNKISTPDFPIGNSISNSRKPSVALVEAIKQESRGNKVMANIFADTAMTTLQKMLSNGDSSTQLGEGTGRIQQEEQFNGTPEQVFGEDISSKWASLAFMDASAKKTT